VNEENHSAFVNGHSEPFVDFDYEAIDRGNPITAELERNPDDIHGMSEAFDKILFWCWSGNGGKRRKSKASFARFVALTAAMRPDIFGNMSYKQIGKELRVTKAWMSRLALEFQDEFGVHFRRSRVEGSRAVFRDKRNESIKARRGTV
jgi:hypothetical protein